MMVFAVTSIGLRLWRPPCRTGADSASGVRAFATNSSDPGAGVLNALLPLLNRKFGVSKTLQLLRETVR